jgi:NAD(P)H-flavin reductase/hemoglobin-like flavoprotein
VVTEDDPAVIGPLDPADRQAVMDSFSRLAASQQFAMEYLYARLFVQNPELRTLFPLSMEHTRATTFGMLARLISSLHDPPETDVLLDRLGRDHRKFGVRDAHYEPFFDALLATVEQVSGPAWSEPVSRAWLAVLGYFATSMRKAAADDAKAQPAWWIGEIVQHDRRTPTIAVLTIRPDRPLRYQPGQYICVQVAKWPRLWRKFSIANAPRENGLIDIHVRTIPGGMVSTALVNHSGTGDTLTLAAARGDLRVPADIDRDVVCVAGGTGLAPIKSIVEAIVMQTKQGKRRSVTLYLGARCDDDLYDMRDLATLRLAYPALELVKVVDEQDGTLPEAVAKHESFRNTEVYAAGPAGLVSATVRALGHRVPSDRFHHDPLDMLMAASRPAARGQLSAWPASLTSSAPPSSASKNA